MAATRKYEGFADIDATAPDVYETPDLADDLSTAQDTSARSPSIDSEVDDGTADDKDVSKIDKREWKATDARSRFRPTRIKAEDVDFSDRLNLNQRSYKTYAVKRRQGIYDDEPDQFGDISDDEDESLDHRLARLQREVEQLRVSISDAKSTKTETATKDQNVLDGIEKLSEALDAVYEERHGGLIGADVKLSQTMARLSKTSSAIQAGRVSPERAEVIIEPKLTQILSKAADLDQRLGFLEASLGVSGANMPELISDFSKALLPSLLSLEHSIQIATAQPATLESAHSKTKQLLRDAERLSRQRTNEEEDNKDQDESAQLSTDQVTKINALYSLLPTIDSISPSLPLVLDRLRSLQILHTNASDASEILDEIEKRHVDQAEEINSWRQALDKIEANLEENENTLSENMEKMGGWVRDLESRAAK